jgi:hypothetical protein
VLANLKIILNLSTSWKSMKTIHCNAAGFYTLTRANMTPAGKYEHPSSKYTRTCVHYLRVCTIQCVKYILSMYVGSELRTVSCHKKIIHVTLNYLIFLSRVFNYAVSVEAI